jgi:hypothetical protein
MLVWRPENPVFQLTAGTSGAFEDVMTTDQLTIDGTITDVPSPLRTCSTCQAEFFVEAVSTSSRGHRSATPARRYTLRCPNGHEKAWVGGAAELSDSE